MHKLAVKLEGIERRKRTTGLLHVAAGCFLLLKSFDYLQLLQYRNAVNAIPFFAAAVISLLYGVLKKSRDPLARLNPWIRLMQVCVFAVLAIRFISYENTFSVGLLFAWVIGCLLLMFTERKVFQDAAMIFNNQGIVIPGYFSNRRLFWNGVKEVVVRPDYITIFRNSDSFLQYEVLNNMPVTALDEIALYCKEQVLHATKAA